MNSRQMRAVSLAFLAHNMTIGMISATFGPLVPTLAARFDASRALVSYSASLWMVMLGLTAPIVGVLLQRLSLRTMMVAGAAVNAAAFALMSVATSIWQVLALYGLAGVGSGMLGIICPTALISRWFDQGHGRILGIVTLPLLMLVTPIVLAKILLAGGTHPAFLTLAAVFAVIALVMTLVIDRPAHQPGAAPAPAPPTISLIELLRNSRFVILTVGIGLMAGSGSAFAVHTVSFIIEKGMPLTDAASVYSTYAVAGFGGTVLFGWLADRLGAPASLMISAALFSATLALLVIGTGYPALIMICSLAGLALISLNALHGAALAAMFGSGRVAVAMGLSFFLKVPFLLVFAPMVGHVYDVTGSNANGFMLLAATAALASLLFAYLFVSGRSTAPAAA